ncbi:MAG TPA: FAD/NAD(P)-binding protein [Propionibacteriaceae bacterium]|nr:FAD/NAD(P)-binding protein [Propionibacteriaceae bacterium]HPZ49503.1 FAD/NAD(P)-binding protein [Propionibacteriaceae bacterium]HQE31806.1 FAD/NAD(P)-binding protein [Propionibacteriaceae bacterium]
MGSLVVVGVGPRGVSVVERIAARQVTGPLTLHLVDPYELGAGRVWRTDQDRELCMNTLAGAVTLFTDSSFGGSGPVAVGPTLYEWCILARESAHEHAQGQGLRPSPSPPSGSGITAEVRAAYDAVPVRESFLTDPQFLREIADIRPESHPSRALYGEYLVWCLAKARAALGPGVEVAEHRTKATAIARTDRGVRVDLADGSSIDADAAILGLGWLNSPESSADAALRRQVDTPSVLWVSPNSPVDQDLSGITPGEAVIARGLGMGFFDSLSLLTLGRGGRFEPAPGTDGRRLVYLPSGDEPVVHVGTRRGMPFRAKSLWGGLPPMPTQRHLRGRDWSVEVTPIDVQRTIWPLVARDAYENYYATWSRLRPGTLTADMSGLIFRTPAAQLADATHAAAPDLPRFDLARLADPAQGTFPSPAGFDSFVRSYLDDDLTQADLGADSPVKMGLWSVSVSRRFVSQLTAFDGTDAESYDGPLARLMAFGGMVGSGPPAFRNRQLLALAEAGLVRFVGPRMQTWFADGAFRASSPQVDDSHVEARVLLDAWMRFHDARDSADPLISSLLDAGLARPYARRSRHGGRTAGASLDVDPTTTRVITASGTPDAAIHVIGIPVDEARADTIISPMPSTDPTMLRETDAAVASALSRLLEVS